MQEPRRVGLNALFLDPGVSGGSETYLRELVPALKEAQPELSLEITTTRRGEQALRADGYADLAELIGLRCDDDQPVRRTAVEHLLLPRLARRRGWQVLHSLANRGPRRVDTASVVTVLDVIFFRHRTMGLVSTHGMRWAVRAAVRGANAIIAISDVAGDDIARSLGVERARITTVPLGPGRRPIRPADSSATIRRLGIDIGPIVLCVAAKRPHKNQALLVEALPRLPENTRLVLVGHDEGYGEELTSRAARLEVRDRVFLLEPLPDAELEALWQVADCAALPTLAEGFGLPVLEAMTRGVPMACSDLPVLREVAGDAVHYFDPGSAEHAAAAIAAAMEDGGAAERGRKRAAGFSWERTARQTLDVYRAAVQRRCASAST